jgi:hypothetical protein
MGHTVNAVIQMHYPNDTYSGTEGLPRLWELKKIEQ